VKVWKVVAAGEDDVRVIKIKEMLLLLLLLLSVEGCMA